MQSRISHFPEIIKPEQQLCRQCRVYSYSLLQSWLFRVSILLCRLKAVRLIRNANQVPAAC